VTQILENDLYTLQDPTKQYPQPEFEPQTQTVPGLAGAMRPKPDHGEKSYRGSGRLRDRKALVTGGDSVCARGRRCGDQLFAERRSGCEGSD
jgi:hypothetical protein